LVVNEFIYRVQLTALRKSHLVYLLAWWLDLDVPLSPKIGASSMLGNLLQEVYEWVSRSA
jgi:hypothetical protein